MSDFEDRDIAAVESVLYAPGLSAEIRALIGPRWMGWVGPGESLPEDPEPSSELRTPTAWGQWEVHYLEPPSRMMDGSIGAYVGQVILEIRVQHGAGDRHARKAIGRALEELEAASTDSRVFLYDNRMPLPTSGGFAGRQGTLNLVGAGG